MTDSNVKAIRNKQEEAYRSLASDNRLLASKLSDETLKLSERITDVSLKLSKKISDESSKLSEKINATTVRLYVAGSAAAVGMLGVMAKGFKWL